MAAQEPLELLVKVRILDPQLCAQSVEVAQKIPTLLDGERYLVGVQCSSVDTRARSFIDVWLDERQKLVSNQTGLQPHNKPPSYNGYYFSLLKRKTKFDSLWGHAIAQGYDFE